MKQFFPVIHRITVLLTIFLAVAVRPGIAAADLAASIEFNISPQQLPSALLKYSEQSGVQVSSAGEIVEGKMSKGVVGTHSARGALEQLLKGTDLRYDEVDSNTVAIRGELPSKSSKVASPPKSVTRLAQSEDQSSEEADGSRSRADEEEAEQLRPSKARIPEVLVTGSRILNTDIPRTEDDPQPYVVLDRKMIERSGATNLEDFLKTRLPMNTQGQVTTQNGSSFGSVSSVNLRGLGANQTLILIDGHRLGDWNAIATPGQGDLNGIPLAAVERIEVLPTTASGIYGGGATGGVINIILRRDYTGSELKLTYDNTFDTDSAQRRIDFATGFDLGNGRTNVLLVGSYSDSNSLRVGDRDVIREGAVTRMTNNPVSTFASFPPLAATPNILSTTGEALVLDDGAGLGSSFTSVPVGYGGFTTDNGAALVANAGQYNLNLADTPQQGGGFVPGKRYVLLTVPTIKSGMATLRHRFSDGIEAFLELGASDTVDRRASVDAPSFITLAADAPNNPFQQEVNVSLPIPLEESETISRRQNQRAVGGVLAKLPGAWSAGLDFTWNRFEFELDSPPEHPALVSEVVDNAIDIIRDPATLPASALVPVAGVSTTPYRAVLKDTSLRFAGPTLSLPAGRANLTLLLEHRDETFEGGIQLVPSADIIAINPGRDQTVRSVYAEMLLPLVAGSLSRPGVSELELQLSGRYDHYEVNGVTSAIFAGPGSPPPPPIERSTAALDSLNPTVALRWKVNQDVALRASYGTGFLPPSVNQVLPTPSFGPVTVTDPRRGDSSYSLPTGAVLSSGNPNLDPESSESWSAGFVATPRFAPQLRLSVDYTRIEKTDNIAAFPGGVTGLLDNESLVPDRIIRGPNLPGDPAGFAGPITFIDNTLINLARTKVDAYDVQADYSLPTDRFGTFDFYVVATWQTHYETQLATVTPVFENVGFTSNNPLKFKGNAGFTWTRGPWSFGWDSRYFDSYWAFTATSAAAGTHANAIRNQGGNGRVDSQIYHDARLTYRFGESPVKALELLSQLELSLGLKNIFNTEPPFDATFGPFYYSPYGDIRLASYWLSLRAGF